jgi:predicted ATPase
MVESQPYANQASGSDSLAQSKFVGRQREIGELKVDLEEALSGQGRLVMLVGEPGIGKTRTARELAAHATLQGAGVLWGRCYAEPGAPPYWPWVQVIRSYVRDHSADELRSQMGAGAADIAEVVSEVKEHLPDLQPPPALEPQQARFRLFDSITTFLKRASQFQPLMLVLDNLHWADRPSLLLLEFLAQELAETHLLLVGTYRDTELTRQHPLGQTLGELTREPLFRRMPLRGLTEKDVGQFIKVTAGFSPPGNWLGQCMPRPKAILCS